MTESDCFLVFLYVQSYLVTIFFFQTFTQLTFDHANVVSAVSYSQSDGLLVFLDEFHHLGFLQRRDSAADNGFARTRCRHKLCLHVRFECMSLSDDRKYFLFFMLLMKDKHFLLMQDHSFNVFSFYDPCLFIVV